MKIYLLIVFLFLLLISCRENNNVDEYKTIDTKESNRNNVISNKKDSVLKKEDYIDPPVRDGQQWMKKK